jgi:hypothetical protein
MRSRRSKPQLHHTSARIIAFGVTPQPMPRRHSLEMFNGCAGFVFAHAVAHL